MIGRVTVGFEVAVEGGRAPVEVGRTVAAVPVGRAGVVAALAVEVVSDAALGSDDAGADAADDAATSLEDRAELSGCMVTGAAEGRAVGAEEDDGFGVIWAYARIAPPNSRSATTASAMTRPAPFEFELGWMGGGVIASVPGAARSGAAAVTVLPALAPPWGGGAITTVPPSGTAGPIRRACCR